MEDKRIILDDIAPDGAWQLVHASKGERLLHYIIDYTAEIALMVIIGMIFVPDWLASDSPLPSYLLAIIAHFAYYVTLEHSMNGKTLGKLITQTRVVTHEGYHPALSVILLRTLCRLVPFEPLSFLFNEPGGWHDMWSKTWVVKDRSLPSDYHASKYV